MNRIIFSFWLVVCFIAFSCGTATEQKANTTLSYEVRQFRIESQEGCNAEESEAPCAVYEVSYPVISGLSESVNELLIEGIAEAVNTDNPESEVTSLRSAGSMFIRDFKSFQQEIPDNTIGWYYKSNVEVEILSDTLLSLSVMNEYFTGGAHGGYGQYFINLDPSTGKHVKLQDILKPGYEKYLQEIGEEEFRRANELSVDISLAESGFEFADDKFKLNDNYGFTAEGILFVYNVYEIGPYAMGTKEVLIPYEVLKEWL